MSNYPDHVRHTAQQIIERLQSDPIFFQQIHHDPVDALLAAGLPEHTLGDFMRELSLTADVAGYEFTSPDACSFTCLVTDVPNEGLPGTP